MPLPYTTTASLYRSHQPLPLAIAIQQGNVKTVKTLLESGASKDLTQLVQRQGSDPERRDRDWMGVSAGVHCLATALQKLQRHLTDAMAARPSHPSWEAAEKAGSTGVMAPAALIGVGEGRLLPSGKYSGEETKETKEGDGGKGSGKGGGKAGQGGDEGKAGGGGIGSSSSTSGSKADRDKDEMLNNFPDFSPESCAAVLGYLVDLGFLSESHKERREVRALVNDMILQIDFCRAQQIAEHLPVGADGSNAIEAARGKRMGLMVRRRMLTSYNYISVCGATHMCTH